MLELVEVIKKILPLNWFYKDQDIQNHPGAKNLEKFRGLVKKNNYREKDDLLLKELNIVVLDTETTGLKPHAGDEIISVGACLIRDGEVLPEGFNKLVNPFKPIPRFITELTGINDEMVAEAEDFYTVMCDFLDFLKDNIIVGHSIEFDINFFNYKLKPLNIKINNYLIDTGILSKALNPHIKLHTLDSIVASMDINPDGRHTALGDALLTAGVFLNFQKQLEDLRINTLFDLRCYVKNAMLYRF